MNREVNRKTIVERPTDLKNRKLTLPMNRSWLNMNAASKLELNHREGKSRNIPGKTSNFDKHFAKAGEDESEHSRDVPDEEQYPYDTVKTSSLEAMHALTILPAKPIQESEYADQRYLGNSATTHISRNTKSSIIIQTKSSDSPRDLGQCRYLSEESRVPNVKGEKEKVIGSQHPLPPPRPLKTLPKKYQPLPPEPERSNQLSQTRKICSQAHTFPMSAKNTRHLELNEAPGKGRDISREVELSFQTRQQKTKYPASSPPCMLSSKSFQGSGSRLNIQNCSTERSPSPGKLKPSECRSQYKYVNLPTPHLTKPVEKDLNKYDWYIGEFDRQKAEEALLQENTDETFLVRDCSTKSSAEPYVLVIYYGNKVYNIKIRFLEDSQQYALGTGLRGDYKFDSVQEIIDFYTCVPITLIDGKDKSGIQREQCYLTHPFKLNRRCFLP
ncbi:unnamed protein product [Eretmochelys imbricata]